MNPVPRVLDLSHWNVVPKDFSATKEAGIVAIIHKCTESTTVVDNKVQARHFLAREADMAFGLYHFLRKGNQKEAAKFFVHTAVALDVLDDDTLLVADHEDHNVPIDQLSIFLEQVEKLAGRQPAIYSGHVLKDQCATVGYPFPNRLWLCHYCEAPPVLPVGCQSYWLWQYTDKGSIAGVQSPVDLNHFDGETEPFLEGWAG